MKRLRKFLLVLILPIFAIFLAACDEIEDLLQLELDNIKAVLNIGYKEGDELNSVTQDLELVTEHGNATITWSSSNEDAITITGEVTRGEDNVDVTLTATIKIKDLETEKRFNVTVIGLDFEYHRVSFNADGGSPVPALQNVREGNTASRPDEDPVKDRFEFIDWFVEDEDDPFDFETPIADNVSLIAKWELIEALVDFNLGFASPTPIDSQKITVGEKANKPDDPIRDRHTFLGWFLGEEEEAFDFDTTTITSDIILVAKWDQDEILVTYDLGYPEGEAPDEETLFKGDKVTEPADPTRDRFEFVGWFEAEEEEAFDFEVSIQTDIHLIAKWNQLEAVVTFDAKGGTPTPEQQNLEVGKKADQPPIPINTGFEFLGWFVDNELFDFDNEVTRDIHLVAQWQEEDIVINATIVAPRVVTYYIGSGTFDPLDDVYAFDNDTDEDLDVYVSAPTYRVNLPGTFNYRVAVVGAPDIEKTIKLTVKPRVEIPAELTTAPIEITLWHSNGSAIEGKLKEYAKDFENMMRQKGHQIKVNIDKPASTYDDLRSTFINAIKGAELPNLIQNYPDHVVEYDKNGVIVSLAPYIHHPIHGMDPDVPEESLDDILYVYREENKSNNLIGDYLSLPFSKSTEVATYNKTFFDAVLKGRPFPETWQDLFGLIDDILDIKDDQIDAISQRWADAGKARSATEIQKAKDQFVPFTYDSMGNAFISLTRQFGGEYTARNIETGKGEVRFINDNTIRMLEYFGEERGRTFTVPQFWGADYGNAVSIYGTTIFSVGSTGGIRYNTPVEEGYKLYDIGVAPVPYDKFNPSSKAVIQQGPNISLTNSGTDQQRLASWLFLKYLTSRDVQVDFGTSIGYSPVRNSSYETPEYQAYLAKADQTMADNFTAAGMTKSAYAKEFEEVVMAMGSRVAATQRNFSFYDDAFIGSSKAREEVGQAFERVILYEGSDLAGTINSALQAAKAETEKITD